MASISSPWRFFLGPGAWTVNDKSWRLLSCILIVLVGLIMLITFRDYGLTVDEEFQSTYADGILAWYTSFFRDRAAVEFNTTVMLGGFFEVIAQSAARVLPFGLYESRHLVNCVFGLVAIVTAYRLGSYIVNPMAGFFSALFLTLTPVFYGHSFNNPKDLPFAAMYLVATYFILLSYDHLPRPSTSLLIKTSVSIGLATAIRVGGLILFGYLALFWAAWFVVQWRAGAFDGRAEVKKAAFALSSRLGLTVIVGWAAMLVWWPWAQISPLVNPFKALITLSRFDLVTSSFFNGSYIDSADLPWTYLPTWFCITLPEFYLIALFSGCCRFGGGLIPRFKEHLQEADKLIKTSFVGLAAIMPVIGAIVLHSRLGSANRYFLFTVPPLAVLAGVSFAAVLKSSGYRYAKALASVLILIAVASTAHDMIQLHPYEYIYFNRVIGGGLKRASAKFETEYWGSSFSEGAEWLIENYHPDCREVIRVAPCAPEFQSGYYFDKSIEAKDRFRQVAEELNGDGERVEGAEPPHVVLSKSRETCYRTDQGKVLHIVERQGVPLLYIIELHHPR